VSLDRAVGHLVGAQSELRNIGLRSRSSRVDVAVYHIGQAIYGSNVHTPKEAERHTRIALRSLGGEMMRGLGLKDVRRRLREAIKEMRG
jgi:hypothetical protein